MPSARNAPAGAATRDDEVGPLDLGRERRRAGRDRPSVETAAPRTRLSSSMVSLHRLLEPDRERKEVLVDAVERDRPRLGDLAQERLELPERRVVLLPGGALRRGTAPRRAGRPRPPSGARGARSARPRSRAPPPPRARGRGRSTIGPVSPSSPVRHGMWSARPGSPKVSEIGVVDRDRRSAGSSAARAGRRRGASSSSRRSRRRREDRFQWRGRRGSCGSRRSRSAPARRTRRRGPARRSRADGWSPGSRLHGGQDLERLRLDRIEAVLDSRPRIARAARAVIESRSATRRRRPRRVVRARDGAAGASRHGDARRTPAAARRAREPARRASRARAPSSQDRLDARSVSAKSVNSASGLSAARRSGLVIPVATATARTPRLRAAGDVVDRVADDDDRLAGEARAPCARRARSTAIGGSSYRSAESLPNAPKGK